MLESALNKDHYVLKMRGKHGLVFKTKHNDRSYLEKVATEMLELPDSHFSEYEIHNSNHSNEEMTHPEYLIHPNFD